MRTINRNRLTAVFFISAWLILTGSIALASQVLDPTDIGIGARPLGMGRAFTAIADDNSALFINPAGLAQKKNVKFLTMWGNLMAEVPYNVVATSIPMWGGTIGAGYSGLQVSGIRESVLVGGIPQMTGNEGSFNNSSVNLAYATDVSNIPMFSKLKAWASTRAGISIKMVRQGFSGFTSVEAMENNGYDMDLGLITNINDETNFGLSLKNIIPGKNLGKDELPMSVKAGISKYFPNLKLLTDLDIDIEADRNLLVRAGCEWSIAEQLKLRLGLDQKPNAGSTITDMAAGIGLSFKGMSFDYAYHTFAGLPELATHFFSISIAGDEIGVVQTKEKPSQPAVEPKAAEKKIEKSGAVPPKKTSAKKPAKKTPVKVTR